MAQVSCKTILNRMDSVCFCIPLWEFSNYFALFLIKLSFLFMELVSSKVGICKGFSLLKNSVEMEVKG